MSHLVIRTIRLAHCKRGPETCETCREMDTPRLTLLDVDPPDAGLQQRRVIEIVIDGASAWREYDVVRTFEDEDEARAYAKAHGIEDVDVSP